MTNDSVQTMIERYKRELMDFNKRRPYTGRESSQLTDAKLKAVETLRNAENIEQDATRDRDEGETLGEAIQTATFLQDAADEFYSGQSEQEDNADGSIDDEEITGEITEEIIPDTNEYSGGEYDGEYTADGTIRDGRIVPQTGMNRLDNAGMAGAADPDTTSIPPQAPAQESGGAIGGTGTTPDGFAENAAQYPPYGMTNTRQFDSLQEFLEYNTKTGTLRVQVFAADQSFPISNARVVVSRQNGDAMNVFYTEFTDSSGVVFGLTLPTPDKSLSVYPTALMPYATYDVTVEHPRFVTAIYKNCALFDGIETIQQSNLVPKDVNDPNQPVQREYNEAEIVE